VVWSPPATKDIGALGREIESRQSMHRMVAFKNLYFYLFLILKTEQLPTYVLNPTNPRNVFNQFSPPGSRKLFQSSCKGRRLVGRRYPVSSTSCSEKREHD
jgi:hypothetical protein